MASPVCAFQQLLSPSVKRRFLRMPRFELLPDQFLRCSTHNCELLNEVLPS